MIKIWIYARWTMCLICLRGMRLMLLGTQVSLEFITPSADPCHAYLEEMPTSIIWLSMIFYSTYFSNAYDNFQTALSIINTIVLIFSYLHACKLCAQRFNNDLQALISSKWVSLILTIYQLPILLKPQNIRHSLGTFYTQPNMIVPTHVCSSSFFLGFLLVFYIVMDIKDCDFLWLSILRGIGICGTQMVVITLVCFVCFALYVGVGCIYFF